MCLTEWKKVYVPSHDTWLPDDSTVTKTTTTYKYSRGNLTCPFTAANDPLEEGEKKGNESYALQGKKVSE